ncbi:DUF6438 domain-containing protein [Chryseobacterium echinoideorum]|uniref:DUF6438 domain-containing protein n=1 Tax=Chryseobacterium echinoideorum TaxID=1549648 RepID=UPI001184ACDA|nr:DUF6438 domain-containing protein [Chryseobacterium echinoideorum]
MKILNTIIYFSLLSIINCNDKESVVKKTEIDNLKSQEEVQSFIRKTDSTFNHYEVKKIEDFKTDDLIFLENQKIAKKEGVNKSFYKTDFDNNGYTDLLVLGDAYHCISSGNQSCSYDPIVILSFGNNKYRFINFSLGLQNYLTPKIKKINGKNLLSIYKPIIKSWEEKKFEETPFVQNLEYKFGEFVEYNSNDKNYIPIQKIELLTSGCFGTCPVFQLSIDQNRNAHFIAEHFNFSNNMESWSENIEGKFHTVIDEKQYESLTGTLQYIDFPNLKDNYAVNWTDDQTVILKITYAGNKLKVIQDYGATGTYGLRSTYKKLFDLRKNQHWSKN